MPNLILASSSKQRQCLLTAAGWRFQVKPSQLDEQAIKTPSESNRALHLAGCKADELAREYADTIILAADTIVCHGGDILEKPVSQEQAKRILHNLSGNSFEVHTGVALRYQNQSKEQLVVTKVQMRTLSEQEINRYVQHNPVMTWSAGFSPAYPEGMALLARVSGSLTGLTHGLPIEVVSGWLIDLGVHEI